MYIKQDFPSEIMLNIAERGKPVNWSIHTFQSFKERRNLFPHCEKAYDIFKECVDALRNPNKGIIFPDDRETAKSTHYLMFSNDYGNLLMVPIAVNEKNIHLFTLKDLKEDKKPNWYIEQYNKIARTRDMQEIPRIFKIP